jgi:hypothetical protein
MIDKKAITTWVAFYIGKIEMFPGKERLTTMVMAQGKTVGTQSVTT